MVATDRIALQAATRQYERAEEAIENLAIERRRRALQMARFHAATSRPPRSSSNAERASEAVNVFHRKSRLSKAERLKREAQEEHERARRRNELKAERRERRGLGPVRKCVECQTIYRGDADTCGCKPCVHCTQRFRGDGRKCESCKADPELITARGRQTDGAKVLEPQPSMSPLSPESKRVQAVIDGLQRWMQEAIELKYTHRLNDHKAADELMIPVPVFNGRVRAAVARVAELLAIEENSRV
jgi:hypothetical protein